MEEQREEAAVAGDLIERGRHRGAQRRGRERVLLPPAVGEVGQVVVGVEQLQKFADVFEEIA